jgi:hypothetical protein
MKHRFLNVALAGVAVSGLLAGCATTVDWGGPLGHYRYHYDSRPVVYSSTPSGGYYREPSTYEAPAVVERPAVTYYHHDDDDD